CHSRQLLATLRRRFCNAADVARARRATGYPLQADISRLPNLRLRSGRNGDRSSARCPEVAEAHCCPDERNRPLGIERSVRRPGYLLPRPLKYRSRQAKRKRRIDFDWPPIWDDWLADGRDDRQRNGAPEGALRRCDDVRRRRPGRCRIVRTSDVSRILLVRHAQASFLEQDYDKLSPTGEAQARLLGEYWASRNVSFDRVYSGPRVRQIDTAKIVAGIYRRLGATFPEPAVMEEFDEYQGEDVLRKSVPGLLETDARIRDLHGAFQSAVTSGEKRKT